MLRKDTYVVQESGLGGGAGPNLSKYRIYPNKDDPLRRAPEQKRPEHEITVGVMVFDHIHSNITARSYSRH
ncbi:hypothetical protein [Kiloniella sp.]|uniref:hypothetical protein n=1 Tax=Kiloniella sp. TaxID=1938587 RepID=UPI003A9520AE